MEYGKRNQRADTTLGLRLTQKQRDHIEAVHIEDKITLSEVVKRLIDEDMNRRKMGVSTKGPRRRY